MFPLQKGKYRVRLAADGCDLDRAQALRQRCFRSRDQARGQDADRFDPLCRHILIEETSSSALVGCFRLMQVAPGESVTNSYAGQVYDLTALQGFAGAKLELGRFCLDPAWHDPDILRLAWGAITMIVDTEAISLLFGCSSFLGADPAPHHPALAALRQHLPPSDWPIKVKAPQTFPYARALADHIPDQRAAMQQMPPLLRTYLAMGGWVSDHAVIDHDLDTLHVFTAVEIARIPAARARALRMVAADLPPDHAGN